MFSWCSCCYSLKALCLLRIPLFFSLSFSSSPSVFCARCKQRKIPTFRKKKVLDSRNNTQQQRERFFSNFYERWEAAAAHDDVGVLSGGCGYGFEKYMFSLCVCLIRLCCFFSLHNIHIPLTRRAVVQHSCIHTFFVSSLSLSRAHSHTTLNNRREGEEKWEKIASRWWKTHRKSYESFAAFLFFRSLSLACYRMFGVVVEW